MGWIPADAQPGPADEDDADAGALAEAIAADPRRLCALIGPPGAAPALALALARRFGGWYRDPLEPPYLAEVDELATLATSAEQPVVVLDGPVLEESLAHLPALVSRLVHPRLRVVVPCDGELARRLAYVAGDYPRGSIMVAAIDRAPLPPPPLPAGVAPAELAAFALAGRVPTGALPGEAAAVAAGAVGRSADDTSRVMLLGEDPRRALALAHLEVARSTIERVPATRLPILCALARWHGGELPGAAAEVVVAFDAPSLPDALALLRAGVPLAPATRAALEARALRLREYADDEGRTTLALRLASLAQLRAAPDAAVAYLREAAARAPSAHARAEALTRLSGATRDVTLCERAVEAAELSGEVAIRRQALDQHARLLRELGRPGEARSACAAWLEGAEAELPEAAVAGMRSLAAALAFEDDDPEVALALQRQVVATRLALGDTLGEVFALYTLARWHIELRQVDDAGTCFARAAELGEAVDDPRTRGYAHFMLGAIADTRAAAAAAAEHYDLAVRAYAELGQVPDRVIAALARSRAAAASGSDAPPGPDPGGAQPDPEASERLVQLGRAAPPEVAGRRNP